jgi:replicative DNA helicase
MTDPLPPHDEESERSVLGAMMYAGQPSVDRVVDLLKPGVRCFYDLRHANLFTEIMEMWQEQVPISVSTVFGRIKARGVEQSVGGLAYAMSLPDNHLPCREDYYCERLIHFFKLRRLIATCTKLAQDAQKAGDEDMVARAAAALEDINDQAQANRGVSDLATVDAEILEGYEKALGGHQAGLLTGFCDLDRLTGGLKPQEAVLLAGTPSAGKTSLFLNIALHAVFAGHPVGMLSLETSTRSLMHRSYCCTGQIDGSRFDRGIDLTEGDFVKMTSARAKVLKNKELLMIDDSGGLTIDQVRAKARLMVRRGAKLIGIDYLQLIEASADGETARVSAISRGIKACAKENNVPVIVISSLNRDSSKAERRPRMSDLRGSGQIEYDGNQIWLLSIENDGPMPNVLLEVAKNKDGPTGEVTLMFMKSQFRFCNAAKIEPQDAPRPYKD